MRAIYGVVILVSLLVLATPSGLDSCAVAGPDPVFTAKHRPADVRAFAKGKVGVVQVPMQRIYMIGAYRILSGVPLSDAETAALYPEKKQPVEAPQPHPGDGYSAAAAWLQAREKIPGTARLEFFRTVRSQNTPGSFLYYENCLDDALTAARNTLEARAKLWGETSPNLKAWLAAQDQVFSNCSGDKPAMPSPAEAGADPLLAADRRYQIAAAWFYAGNWEKARAAFDEIAADNASSWHGIAPYLAARTYLREAIVDGHAEAFAQAAKRFEAIAEDASRPQWHEPSRKMLELIRCRQDPAAQLKRLGARLMQRDAPGDISAAAADFIYLYQRNDDKLPGDKGEIADWIEAIERPSPEHANAAVARWREHGNPAWLVAALASMQEKDAAELVQAARALPVDSPAYESAVYYGIQVELRAGHKEQARAWADEVLGHDLLLSSRNLILGQRMEVARDWTEFLRFAPRRPEPRLVNFDGIEEDTDKPPSGTEPIFDADSIAILNGMTPLSLWSNAVSNPLVPKRMQLQLAEAGWIRAVLLKRDADARAFLKRAVQLNPAYAAAARPFLNSANEEDARFAAALMLMKSPDVVPSLWVGNATPDLTSVSTLGGGRWCFGDAAPRDEQGNTVAKPGFLTPEQDAEATAERKALWEVSASGANFLASEAIARARNYGDDPRVPEALHFAVQTTRRGCSNADTGKLSKEAFDLLHQKYPKSPWTAQTRYWYK